MYMKQIMNKNRKKDMTHQLAKEDLVLKQGHEGTWWNTIFIRHKVFRHRSKTVEPLERPIVPIVSNHRATKHKVTNQQLENVIWLRQGSWWASEL